MCVCVCVFVCVCVCVGGCSVYTQEIFCNCYSPQFDASRAQEIKEHRNEQTKNKQTKTRINKQKTTQKE